MEDGPRYTVFVRTWWKNNPAYPNGLEPHAGKRKTIGRNLTYREARQMCAEWNASHNPGRYSKKAEFEQQ